MTTARQRRGNSNAETESSDNGAFMGHETKYFADGRCTSWQHGRRQVQARRSRPHLPQEGSATESGLVRCS